MRKTILALAATTLLAAAPAADAADYTVTGGQLDWTIANAFTSFGDPTRTWLGYLTNTTGGAGASNGSAKPTAPATATGPDGAPVTEIGTTSPRGLDQLFTLTYPVAEAGGTYTDTGVGSVELGGKFTFTTHDLPITLVDPKLTLTGLTGTMVASGSSADQRGNQFPYDRSKTQFTLDLSNAEVKLRADGSFRITGIVPLSTADSAMSGFDPGSNRYGTMSLTLALTPSATQIGAAGRDGANGRDGLNGKDGANGRDATFSVIRLARAPFKTKAEVHVRLIDRATGKSIARGTVEQRTLRLGVLSGTTIKGTYLLKRTAKKASGKLQATVTIG
jgi:hypothetical protein